MKVIVKEGMKFYDKDGSFAFEVKNYPFYDDSNENVLCAFTETEIYPLSEIILDHYIPEVDGIKINEPNEFYY